MNPRTLRDQVGHIDWQALVRDLLDTGLTQLELATLAGYESRNSIYELLQPGRCPSPERANDLICLHIQHCPDIEFPFRRTL